MVNRSAASPLARAAAGLLSALLLLPLSARPAAAADGTRAAFDWGARLRLRQEYLANVYDFSEAIEDDYNYLRVRPQLWGSWEPSDRWKLYAMIANEHRHWFKSNAGLEDKNFEIHELLVENLYVEGKKLGGTPFGFVLGRQNLFYGEGFVCWDGGPLDGSRTAYFNALLLTAAFEKRRFEIHFIADTERDQYLTPVNDQRQQLVETDETGAGVYFVDESMGSKKLEAYYFFKSERDDDGDYPESDIHTIGARASGEAAKNLSFAAEGAVQFGDRGSSDRIGYGGYVTLKQAFRPFALGGGGIYLSGDEHSRDRYEGWNPLYSRWPKWSDLFIYTLKTEKGPAYWENIASLWLGSEYAPCGRAAFELQLRFLWAPEARWEDCADDCAEPPQILSDEFAYRGTMSTVKLNWTANAHLAGHLVWEMLLPGDYYAGDGDAAHFLRWEMQLRY